MWKHPHCFESLLIVLSLTQLASSHNENANNFQIITILCRLFMGRFITTSYGIRAHMKPMTKSADVVINNLI